MTVPLIAHVIHRLDIGGLENGLVNIINHMPAERFRHAIICLTSATEFRRRIKTEEVPIYELNKRDGNDMRMHLTLWRLLLRLSPRIVHTRNVGALECVLPAFLARVPYRVHGEHGFHLSDVKGENRRYVWLRCCLQGLIDRYVPMSADLERWLIEKVGVQKAKVTQIYNGVDCERFHPSALGRGPLPIEGFAPSDCVVIGSVGRMDPVKDQLTLIRSFVELIAHIPHGRRRLRLVHIGDGELKAPAQALLRESGLEDLAWLPGARSDIASLLRSFDIFVLPSLAEGISNTILEAMASGLPVVATQVGGNPELVSPGVTGYLVPPGEPGAITRAITRYLVEPALMRAQGRAGRERVESRFSIRTMVGGYLELYDSLLRSARAPLGSVAGRRFGEW
ncbi:MAG: TIGR03088 family PEP-CTERM/XrtA system glycosyltransferase [Gammaproteobacteria bacterium]